MTSYQPASYKELQQSVVGYLRAFSDEDQVLFQRIPFFPSVQSYTCFDTTKIVACYIFATELIGFAAADGVG